MSDDYTPTIAEARTAWIRYRLDPHEFGRENFGRGEAIGQEFDRMLARHHAGAEFDPAADTTPEALVAWERYSALPGNPGTERYTPEMVEQDAFTAGFDEGRASSRAGDT
jgi:hypothetical protein